MSVASSNPESEDTLHRLPIEPMADFGVHMMDPEGVVASWNTGAQRLKGYTAEEIIGRHFSIFYSEEDRAAGAPDLALSTASREGRFEAQGWCLRKDGSHFWAQVLVLPVPGSGGTPVRFARITRDLTEKNAAGDRRRQATCDLELVLRSLPQGVSYYSPDGTLVYANEMYADMFGLERGAVRPGMTLFDILLAVATTQKRHSDPKKATRELEEKFRSHIRCSERASYVVKCERSRFVAVETRKIHDGSWVSLLKDVTEQRRTEAALLDSEHRYRDIFDNSSNGVFVVEVTSERRLRFEQMNPAAERMFAIANEELRGKFIEDIPQPAVGRKHISRYGACLAAGANIRYEEAVRLPAGDRQFETTLVPIRGRDGTIHRVMGIARDLTEERQLNQMRAEREGYFHTLVENSPDVVVRYDRNCRRVYANPAYEKTTGIPAAAGLGKTPIELGVFGPELAVSFQERIERVIATGVADEINVDFVKNGESLHHSIRAVPERDVDGPVVSVLTIARDMTDRIKAERQLREREQQYHSLVENSPDIIVRYDRNCRRIYVNPAYERSTGAPAAAGLGKTAVEIGVMGPKLATAIQERIERVFATGAADEISIDFVKNGESLHHSIRVVPERDVDGTIVSVLGIGRDMTDRIKAERQLQQREQQYRTLVENSLDFIARYDRQGRRIYVNPAMRRQLGVVSSTLGEAPTSRSALVNPGAFADKIRAVLDLGTVEEMEVASRTVDGRNRIGHVRLTPEFDEQGIVTSVLLVERDITELVESRDKINEISQKLIAQRYAIDQAVIVAITDVKGRITYANDIFCRISGYSREELVGYDHRILNSGVHPREFFGAMYRQIARGEIWRAEVCNKAKDGSLHWLDTTIVPQLDQNGTPTHYMAIRIDITARKAAENALRESSDEIHRLAFYDALTDLPNRTLLHDRVRELIAGAGRKDAAFGFMMLDLDRFKQVNDTLGHTAGDVLLREVAQRLRRCLREEDLVARLGGDEFAILLPNMRNKKGLAAAAARILSALAEPVNLADREITVSASIGIARYPSDSEDFLEILKSSDAAMYKAKGAGRNNCQFYDAGMMARAVDRMMIEASLRKALPRNELELYYQPQVLLPTGCVIGAEALLRWRHPDVGFITPDRFISVAEETGMIVEIGRWVIETACRAAVEWNRHREQPIVVSANVSARQLIRKDHVAVVAEALAATGCRPDWLCLELTESVLLEDKKNAKMTLDALKQLGVSIAIDDFGTGYSALSYLSDFPIDVLKIDRSFIHEIGRDHRKTNLTRAIIGIARALDLELVAEGVETESQSAILEKGGCRIAQGYLYGKPMPREAFTRMLSLTPDERLSA